MKTPTIQLDEKPTQGAIEKEIVSRQRAREIMQEEGIQYTDEELQDVVDFISKMIIISTDHYKRSKEKKAKVISLNSNHPHETKSISIHSRINRRAG
jgi:hypothetical protein